MTEPNGMARTWLQTLTSTLAVILCSFLVSILTARLLGPEGRGLMGAVLLIAGLSSGIAQLGIANALIYHRGLGSRLNFQGLALASIVMITVAALPLAALGSGFFYPPVLERRTDLILLVAATTAAFAFTTTATQITQDLKTYNLARMALPFLTAIFLSLIYVTGTGIGYVEVLWFQMAVTLALTIYCFVSSWSALSVVDAGSVEKLPILDGAFFGYAWRHHGTILLSLLLLNVDKVFLLQIGDSAQFGFYTLSFATTRVLSSVQDSAAVATFSRFAGKSDSRLMESVGISFRLSFVPMLVVAAALAAISPWLVPFLFGEAFRPMVLPFVLLSFEAVVGAASWTLAQRFNAGGRPGLVLLRQGIVVLPLIALMPFLPTENTGTYLAGLMLGAALLRLLITMAMMPMIMGEPIPRILLHWSEVRIYLNLVRKR